jgi:hypothetical protein
MILRQWLLFTKKIFILPHAYQYVHETLTSSRLKVEAYHFHNPQRETSDPLQTFFQTKKQYFIIHKLRSHLDITSQPNAEQDLILSPVIQYQTLLSIVRGTLNTPRAIPAPVACFHSSVAIYAMCDIALELWVSTQLSQCGTRSHL